MLAAVAAKASCAVARRISEQADAMPLKQQITRARRVVTARLQAKQLVSVCLLSWR